MASVDLIAAGKGDDGTLDALFWSTVLHDLRAEGRTLHVKSVGNKPTLDSLAEDVRSLGITTILICFDSDHDGILRGRTSGNGLLYTFGYSWENDALQLSVLKDLFFDLLGERERTHELWGQLASHYRQTALLMNQYTDMEIELRKRGMESLFDRNNPTANLKFQKGIPVLSEPVILKRLHDQGFRRSPRKMFHVWPRDELIFVFGKLVARYTHHLFKAFIKRGAADIDVSFPLFCRMAINRLGQRLQAPTGSVEHYFCSCCELHRQ
jgi:hypothetical protein